MNLETWLTNNIYYPTFKKIKSGFNFPWIYINIQRIKLIDLIFFSLAVFRILQSDWLREFLTPPN